MGGLKIGAPGITWLESAVFPVREVVSRAQRFEEQGYNSVWFPDHFQGTIPNAAWTTAFFDIAKNVPSPNLYFEPTTLMGAVAAGTHRITIGTAVTDTSRNHPATLAQTFLTLDHLAQGRIVLGLGSGAASQSVPYGFQHERPVDRFEESLKIVRLLWEKGKGGVSFEGKYWRLHSAVFDLPAYAGRHPPIWIGANRPRMLKITGRLADGWLGVFVPLPEFRKRLEVIKSAAREAGRNPDSLTYGMFATVIAYEEKEMHDKLMSSPFVKFLSLRRSLERDYQKEGLEHPGNGEEKKSVPGPEELSEMLKKIPMEACDQRTLHGTSEELIDILEKYADAGLQHMVLYNRSYMCDPEIFESSFRCLNKVVSHFNGRVSIR